MKKQGPKCDDDDSCNCTTIVGLLLAAVFGGGFAAMHTMGFNHNPLARQDFTRQPSAMRYQNGGMIMVDPAETYAAARR
jgi:hypothetical protein